VVYQAVTWPRVADLARTPPKSTAFIERYRDRQLALGRDPAVAWTWVPWDRISVNLKRAVLVSEDIGFFGHRGFAMDEMKEALREAAQDHELPRGASTITQQLAKNLWLSPSRNPLRKVKEALLTFQLEHTLSKERIFEVYLNVVEFGPGIYGAEAASRHYFGNSAADLSERAAAELAAGLPKPASWFPGSASSVYQRRVARVEERMSRAAFLWRRLGVTPPVGEMPADTLVDVLSDSLPVADSTQLSCDPTTLACPDTGT